MDQAVRPAPEQELVFKGELFIQRIAELKEELQAALEMTDTLLINLLEVTDIDLSGVQLLCSARKTAARMNKQLRLVDGTSEAAEPVLRLAGTWSGDSCGGGCGRTCLWRDDRNEQE